MNRDHPFIDGRRHLYADGKYMEQDFYLYMKASTHLSICRDSYLLVEKLDVVYH